MKNAHTQTTKNEPTLNNRTQTTVHDILGRRPIHPFPARMAPGIALDALSGGRPGMTVLDPMAGSGTVLAVALKEGHAAIGFDVDPLAVLLARVWTRKVDASAVMDRARAVLAGAVKAIKARSSAGSFPVGCDDETRDFLRYWFDLRARRQLVALANGIARTKNEATRDVLWCAFSRLIITKSAGASLAMDVSHSRPHRCFTHAPIQPVERFISAVQIVVQNCPSESVGKVSAAVVREGDAREMPIRANSVDLILTSPPYLNAIDYLRCSKFSLVWMGHSISSLREIRAGSVGTEAARTDAMSCGWIERLLDKSGIAHDLSPRRRALLSTYVWDMDRAIREAFRVLRVNGRAVYVVGDSSTKGIFIRNSELIARIGERAGLTLVSRHLRDLPNDRRYLPPPTNSRKLLDARMRQEAVIVFNKKSA